MHLRDRSRRERVLFEGREHLIEWAPVARSMMARASAPGNGGTWSWSFASSSAMSAGSRSGRVESAWPNFTKIGPSSSSARRSRTPRGSPRSRGNQFHGAGTEREPQRAVEMGRGDEIVEPVAHQHALDLRAGARTTRGFMFLECFLSSSSAPRRSVGRLAQLVHAREKFVDLGARHEVAALLLQILAHVGGQRRGGLPAPSACRRGPRCRPGEQ